MLASLSLHCDHSCPLSIANCKGVSYGFGAAALIVCIVGIGFFGLICKTREAKGLGRHFFDVASWLTLSNFYLGRELCRLLSDDVLLFMGL